MNHSLPAGRELLEGVLDLVKVNRDPEALALLEGALPDDPYRDSFDYAKAVVFSRLGRKAEGAEVLRGLIARSPGFPNARELLGQLRAESVPARAGSADATDHFYGRCTLGPSTLAAIAAAPETWTEILSFHGELATDRYVRYVDGFYRDSVSRFGRHWHYLDVVNVLYAAAKTIQPRRYLEIGVRRGRSAVSVARAYPDVSIHAFDMWVTGYAGMENPGPEFVRQELRRHGHQGQLEFIDGDSHQTLPAFFARNPGLELDLVLVDGDHSESGAFADLADVIPHLASGGILVMDDISHPAHPYLLRVWRQTLAQHPELSSHEYTELGYGVAFAIKKD